MNKQLIATLISLNTKAESVVSGRDAAKEIKKAVEGVATEIRNAFGRSRAKAVEWLRGDDGKKLHKVIKSAILRLFPQPKAKIDKKAVKAAVPALVKLLPADAGEARRFLDELSRLVREEISSREAE
jgi:ribosomal protein L17